MTTPLLTVAIATFRSERILPKVLDSLMAQDLDRSLYEIWLIDGGSDDGTLALGEKYGCKIVRNPRTEPVYAKFLAHRDSTTKYICVLDHDEVLEHPNSLRHKIEVCQSRADIQAAVGSGYVNPPGYPWVSQYINEFGDPFSRFIYNLSKDSRYFLPTMRKSYQVEAEDETSVTFAFKNSDHLPLIELVAGGSVYDADYVRSNFPETCTNPALIPHFFYLMLEKGARLALVKNDRLLHYSSDSFAGYLRKIRWRINNNVHFTSSMGSSGFTGRDRYGATSLRKYFFLPFSLLIIPALIDSVALAIRRKDFRYLAHAYLTFYTGWQILYQYTRKLAGYRPQLKSYDESTVIDPTAK